MRNLITSALLVLFVSAGAALPACAGASDGASSGSAREWSGRPRMHEEEHGMRRQRQHLAYAFPRERYEDEARPQRHHRRYGADGARRNQHWAKRRHARSAAHHRRGHRIARRSGMTRHAAMHRPHNRHAAAPAWSRESLATAGPRGSGQQGVASYYWEPQRLASGGWFNPNALTAAHRYLPFGTRVRVTHQGSGRSVEVTINDRGPYVAGRIIDLSRAAANLIGMTAQGVAKVRLEVLGR